MESDMESRFRGGLGIHTKVYLNKTQLVLALCLGRNVGISGHLRFCQTRQSILGGLSSGTSDIWKPQYFHQMRRDKGQREQRKPSLLLEAKTSGA